MWVRSLGQEDPQRRAWQLTPVFLPGESHGQRSLEGYSPWGGKSLTRPKRQHIKHPGQVPFHFFPFLKQRSPGKPSFVDMSTSPSNSERFLDAPHGLQDLSSLESNPSPLKCKCRILTPAPPGNSLREVVCEKLLCPSVSTWSVSPKGIHTGYEQDPRTHFFLSW